MQVAWTASLPGLSICSWVSLCLYILWQRPMDYVDLTSAWAAVSYLLSAYSILFLPNLGLH